MEQLVPLRVLAQLRTVRPRWARVEAWVPPRFFLEASDPVGRLRQVQAKVRMVKAPLWAPVQRLALPGLAQVPRPLQASP